jgi:hypothetical protein
LQKPRKIAPISKTLQVLKTPQNLQASKTSENSEKVPKFSQNSKNSSKFPKSLQKASKNSSISKKTHQSSKKSSKFKFPQNFSQIQKTPQNS